MAKGENRNLQNAQGVGRLSANMHTAAEWLAQPKRGGLTLKQVADEADISERQLRKWRKTDEFQKLVQDKINNNVKERMPNVVDAVIKKAEQGSHKHAELLFKMQGLLTEKQEITAIQETPNKEKNNDQIEAELDELRELVGNDRKIIDVEADNKTNN
ncbi:hypothetical protein FH966_00635 [Lentibacillus cibarius]|uniref:Homeodomain phBC6A51-type domain-containing protein n=1 Tax=Lentibacillus cibarius TaxID=2583219 RepID=A0A549YEN4_9BACI|nr:phBC6A51 family helix-turn-helix protein [Lentibacillus cibarius]TRM10343.1 hypothetical protein FH966_00635 [Lentibacillus cibarius]